MSDEPSKDEVAIVNAETDASKKMQFTMSFTVTWKNMETGVVNVGTFTAVRPNLGKAGQIAVYHAKLNGGEKVGVDTDTMHYMMAALRYILTDVPSWWKPDEFFTASPLRDVWDHVAAWLQSFRSSVG